MPKSYALMVTVAATPLLIAFLMRSVRPAPEIADDGRFQMAYPTGFRVMGGIGTLFGAGAAGAAAVVGSGTWPAFAGFGVLGALTLLLFSRNRVLFNDDGVELVGIGAPVSFA